MYTVQKLTNGVYQIIDKDCKIMMQFSDFNDAHQTCEKMNNPPKKHNAGNRCIDKYAPEHDKKAASALVKECLKRGYVVSVYDGEEWTLKRSAKYFQIMEALATTEWDRLLVRDSAGEVIGHFDLIWGNDVGETIADMSGSLECGSIDKAVQTKLGIN